MGQFGSKGGIQRIAPLKIKSFQEHLNEGLKTKVPCRRCGGSGKFSYNVIHGTMCYGCRGTGYQMIDVAAEKKRQQTAERKREIRQQYHDEVSAVTKAYAQELAKKHHWSFNLDTELGLDQFNRAVSQIYGKSFWLLRDERLKKLGIVKP